MAVEGIVEAVLDLAPSGALLELGAGTGEIGAALARHGPYMGLDLSLGMLRVFHDRLSGTRRDPLLAQADADQPWPVRSGWARIVFASRAAHLFAVDHLIAETLRVASPEGAVFGLGRVRRDPGSLRATLRREMRRLLSGHGVEGRGGERAREDLIAAFAERGGTILPPRTAATWPVEERAADSLASWRGKPGLAGTAVPEDVKRDVLDRLEEWAREKYGDLDSIREAAESYELTAVRLPPRL